MPDGPKSFMVEDAQIIFRNFAGKESQYNREGDRNFAVILDPDTAQQMAADGWNVKTLNVRDDAEEGTEGLPYIQVAVNFKNKPPKVVMISSNSRTILDADSVDVLDYTDIRTADLIATAYEWAVGGKSGVKAYLKSLFVTIEEDALERKYAQMMAEEG